MALIRCGILLLLLVLTISSASSIPSILRIKPDPESLLVTVGVTSRRSTIDLHCEGWRFTVETNSANYWSQVPGSCQNFVKNYVTGARYRTDSDAVADCASAYAREVRALRPAGNGNDAWVFDIDETLLSNLPYYAEHGFGGPAHTGSWILPLPFAPAVSRFFLPIGIVSPALLLLSVFQLIFPI